jgi:hypothetical protein
MPPLTISMEQLEKIGRVVYEAISCVARDLPGAS